jgi:hypothetical protein
MGALTSGGGPPPPCPPPPPPPPRPPQVGPLQARAAERGVARGRRARAGGRRVGPRGGRPRVWVGRRGQGGRSAGRRLTLCAESNCAPLRPPVPRASMGGMVAQVGRRAGGRARVDGLRGQGSGQVASEDYSGHPHSPTLSLLPVSTGARRAARAARPPCQPFARGHVARPCAAAAGARAAPRGRAPQVELQAWAGSQSHNLSAPCLPAAHRQPCPSCL